MAGTRLHLVRHGHTGAVGRVLSGRAPIGLDDRGRAEAAAQAEALAGSAIAAAFSSPQPRALQTASPICAALGLPVQTEPALDEVDFGDWAGQPFAALDPEPGWRAWNALRSLAPSPGETMLAVQARVVAFAQSLHAAWPEADLLLVSHADVLRALLAHLLAIPLDLMGRLELSPGGRSIAVLHAGTVRVEAVNLPSRPP